MTQRFVWEPTEELKSSTTLSAFLRRHGLADQDALLAEADSKPAWFWDALIHFFEIRFARAYSSVLKTPSGIEWPVWFADGTTSISWNCLGRHRDGPAWSRDAVVFESETGAIETWSYARLDAETARFANTLRAAGIEKGDAVGLYLPMVPEAIAAFMGIIEIGAIAVPLFSGFGYRPVADRLKDAGARAIVTCPEMMRRGKRVGLLDTVRTARAECPEVQTVVLCRQGVDFEPTPEETIWSTSAPAAPREGGYPIFPAETPAMLMYTSGTTGKPKGTAHTHGGMLAKNALDMGLCLDVRAGDRLLWMSDMGWIVGPKISVGCTLLGATIVLAEGTPDWPQHNRIWQLCTRHGVTVVGIVPTAVRQMMLSTQDPLDGCDLQRLRTVISSGEPWTPEAWVWFFEKVCGRRVPILNYAGGTECGGAILIGTHHRPLRPCAFGGPVPGSGADVVDRGGRSLPPGEVGELVMRRPTIGATRGLWRDPDRYVMSYWREIPGVWVQGDLASRDADGLWYLHGRSDDTIKLAGKRTGPAEIEAALMATGLVADAAVVGVHDETTGSALLCVCVPAAQCADAHLELTLAQAVAEQFGAPFRPRYFAFVSELPKTRNQKIMRRVIRSIATGAAVGDLSSLANPAAVQELTAAFSTRSLAAKSAVTVATND